MDRSKLPPPGAPMLAHALAYAAQGWQVHPLRRGSKKPATQHGFWDATTDTEQIAAWWTDDPDYNIGLATGEGSGVVVLDVDVKDGALGLESFDAMFPDGEPSTLTASTPSGGMHCYYRHPGHRVQNQQSKLANGLDVRGDGGYVVLPPSVVDGAPYAWEVTPEPVPIAAYPPELIPPDQPTTIAVRAADLAAVELTDADRRRLPAYGESAVAAELGKLGTLTYWNQGTYEVACNLVELVNSPWTDLDGQAVFDRFMAAAPKDAGFTDEDVMKRWQSAMRTVGDKARAIPPAAPRSEGIPFAPEADGDLFGKEGLRVAELARQIVAAGPIRWGADGQVWSYAAGVWRPDRDAIERRTVDLLGDRFRTGHAANAVPPVKRRIGTIEADPVPDLINFPNGLLDWRAGALKPHDPEILSTVQMGVPWSADAQCPQFDAFLAEVLSPDYVRLAWQMIGYLMMSGNPMQVAFLLHGSGGNGKGTLLRVIEHVLGKANVSSESLDALNTNRFAAVSLFGKIANLAGDIDATYQESTAAFKKLTGEDLYYAEHKYGQRFGFTSWAVPVFSANKIPGSADTTVGYLRRWVVLQFARTVTTPTLSLSDKLEAEGAGIAAKGVRALRDLMGAGRFAIEGDAERGRDDFAMAIDQVRQFARDETMPAPAGVLTLDEVYLRYRAWADRRGVGRMKASDVHHRLESYGWQEMDGTYVGRSLRPADHFAQLRGPTADPSQLTR